MVLGGLEGKGTEALMQIMNLYETVFVLHPELTEEEVEASIQQIAGLLESRGSKILRIERGGKRRLAYPIEKQRYGYYNLMHFWAPPGAPMELERMYRLNERVLRYLTVRFEKEEQLTGFSRMPEDESREEERSDRRSSPPGEGREARAQEEVEEAEGGSEAEAPLQAETAVADAAPEPTEHLPEEAS